MLTKRICVLYKSVICLLACNLLQCPAPGIKDTGKSTAEPQALYEIDAYGKPTCRMVTGAAWGEDTPENIAPLMEESFNTSSVKK